MTASIVNASTRGPIKGTVCTPPAWFRRMVGTKVKGQLWERLSERPMVERTVVEHTMVQGMCITCGETEAYLNGDDRL